ncbi:class I SAM-dependent methyltransferase [Stratiformator vulcanicus]|nr:methyltransferase domain-containing protein [Stratiformator vulcanicus]
MSTELEVQPQRTEFDSSKFDSAKADAFAERMVDWLNGGALALMISVGHRTGLFDALRGKAALTSSELASAAGLNERYVREWLGAMATGGIVEFDDELTELPTTNADVRYRLPDEHAAVLTRAAGADNLAVTAQFLPILAAVEDSIVHCFHQGGGVPYSSYPRFHEVMAEESANSVVGALGQHILPLVDGLTEQFERGISVLDVGCGRGLAMLALAERYPRSTFIGFDLSDAAVAAANLQASSSGLRNVRFEMRDLSDFHNDAAVDRRRFNLVTAFDAIHDQARPDHVLIGIQKSLAPGGRFLMQDIRGSSCVHCNTEHPIAPFLYTISCLHCMTVSLAQGGMGLGAMWGREKALEMLHEAGFTKVTVHELPHDIQNYFYTAEQ